MNEQLTQRLVARWPLVAIGGGLLVVAAILYGCDSRRDVVIPTGSGNATESCEQKFRVALDKARPASLGIVGIETTLRSDPEDAARSFADWLRQPDCRDDVPTEPLTADGRSLAVRLLGSAEAVETERFTPFDAAHVRDARLDFAAAGRLAADAAGDLDRVVRVFDYVARTVSPAGESTVEVPLTAYEAHLFGRGAAEERTLLFASLLRQLRIDAVTLGLSGTDGGPWWVGVLLDDGVYLFDAELGLPVPAADALAMGPSGLPKPATWAEAVAEPERLTAYRREAGLPAEPITADRLAAPRVGLIGPAAFWRTVMERVELSLPEDRGVLLYDPLHDTSAGPGLYRRVARAGGAAWTEEAIGVWPFPAELEASRLEATDAQRQRLEQRTAPLLGLVEQNAKATEVGPSKSLWETRVGHMSGRAQEAVLRYLLIRDRQVGLADGAALGLSLAEVSLNSQSADEAFYWSAHAQFDRGDYAAAANTARDYVERGGDRADEAAVLRALSLTAAGQTSEADSAIAELPAETVAVRRLRWLASRRAVGTAAASTSDRTSEWTSAGVAGVLDLSNAGRGCLGDAGPLVGGQPSEFRAEASGCSIAGFAEPRPGGKRITASKFRAAHLALSGRLQPDDP